MPWRALHLALAIAGAIAVTALAAGLVGDPGDEGPAEPAEAAEADVEEAHASEDEDTGYDAPPVEPTQPRHEHALCCEDGSTPSRAEASEFEHQLRSFRVSGNEGLVEMDERGYLAGSGTLEDPYVIEHFRVREDLTIRDVDKPLVIRESYVEGQLTLNYAGEHVYVHDNYVHDLRVNENVGRDGPTTAGLWEGNEIAFIGQLRHFGGTFAHNDVGPRPDDVVSTYLSDTGPQDLPENVVWNFDGYHLGHVHNNTVRGRVDAKLHGHFHGSCSDCVPHDHDDEAGFPGGNDADPGHPPRSPHSYRYHTVDFENNTIRVGEDVRTALRFYDENHAGDDQTANSEPNAFLEDLHEHHQYVRIAGNHLVGGALAFDIVVAQDDRHANQTKEALVHLEDNAVDRGKPRDVARVAAYVLQGGDRVEYVAEGNAFAFEDEDGTGPDGYRWVTEGDPPETTGFLLDDVTASHATIRETDGNGARYGVTIGDVQGTPVELEDNRFRAEEDEHHE